MNQEIETIIKRSSLRELTKSMVWNGLGLRLRADQRKQFAIASKAKR